MDDAAYRIQLAALLPPGAAWPREPETWLQRLLHGLAGELARVDHRARDVLEEADPSTLSETLAEWERAYGLPDACVTAAVTFAERRAVVVAKVVAKGGATPAYFVAVAQALGWSNPVVTEYSPWRVDTPIDVPIYGEDWAYAWTIGVDEVEVSEFTAASRVDEPLASWGNEILECVMSRLKPAHTICLVTYG